MVPPDASAYTEAATRPPPAARAVRIETVGASHLAVVEISPVRITPRVGVELCTALKVRVEYAAEPQLADRRADIAEFRARFGDDIDLERVVPRPESAVASAAESGRLTEIARDLAINGKVVVAADDRRKRALDNLPREYLIITDDRRWDADTIAPGAAVPDMVTEFERLAKAKRSRGISARVVTITDIVAGRWGDLRSGSRDLQEVICKFLKFARTHWGTSWLLLGGDVEIVPARKVTSPMVGVYPRVDTVPDDNQAFWTGNALRIKVGVWDAVRLLLNPEHSTLLNVNKGVMIPYEPTATVGRTGWCFYESD